MAVTPEEVLAIVAAETGLNPAELLPDATLTDMGVSSLDVVSVLFELEDRFGIAIEPDSIAPSLTIAQFVDHVVSLTGR